MTQAAAKAIREQKNEIVRRWTAAARAESDAARSLSEDALIDSLPQLIENLADLLVHGENIANIKHGVSIGSEHGKQRAEFARYSLNDLLVEYRLLSHVIFSVLRETTTLADPTEDIINDAIHRGIGNSAAEFMRVRSAAEVAAHIVTGSLADGICTIDGSGRITSLNPAAERMLGWGEKEILGLDLHATIHAPHIENPSDKRHCKILHVLDTGIAARSYEDIFRRKDGSDFPVAFSASPIKQGGIIGAAITFYDISDLKRINESVREDCERLRREHLQAQQQLSESVGQLAAAQRLLESLYEGVQDYAIFTLDPSGYITTWNHGAVRMKQYSAEEAIGSHFSILYAEEARVRGEAMGHLKSAAIEGRFRGEGMRRKKSGELFLADVLITPMYQDGELVGYSKVVQDLSERSSLLQERDLSRTRIEALEQQQRVRETVVTGLAHDLRNPLSAASACLQLIARAPCDDERHAQLAARATQNLNRAVRMLSDLLDANRIEAGEGLPLKLTECDLVAVAKEVLDELTSIHGSRFVVKPDKAVIGYLDDSQLRRVIENLANNAIKYGDPHSPVTIAIEPVKDRVLLKVHNLGDAIKPEDRQLIFEQFRRAGAQRHSGWGLGLTLVRGIAEAHGGIVKVESYPIEGTTFTVDLPIDARVAKPPQQPGQLVD